MAPVFLYFLFAILGIGTDGLYQLYFDDAVRNAARQIQIGGPASASGGSFVAAICNEFGVLAVNCTGRVTYSVQAATVTTGFAALTPALLSASGSLPNTFFSNGTAYGDNVNVLVQAAYPLPFFLPFVATLVTATGTSSITAAATIRAEPL